MAPILRFVTSSGSKKKEPRYACLSEAKASHTHRTWTEVSSSVLHFLQVGLLLNPITYYKCLLRVLCPVGRSVTTLDCVLLKDSNQNFVTRLGALNQSLSLSLSTTRTTRPWQMLVVHPALILLLIFCLETPRGGLGHTNF